MVACGPGLVACDRSNLQFRNDHRLTFQEPASRAEVVEPFTLRWSMRDFDATGLDGSSDIDRGVYAVFIDRAPMPVGKDLRWLVRKDKECLRTPTCPDQEYLQANDIYLTTDTTVLVQALPKVQGVGKEEHTATIVLLDGEGTRRTESSWYLSFRRERRG